MQTFLPFSDFEKSAAVLDGKRLWKQRVETLQIMQTLAGISHGWKNHPAVKMWKGFEATLLDYQAAIISEGLSRGYKDNVCWDKSVEAYAMLDKLCLNAPEWLGNEVLHASHRSNLLRKNVEWYGVFGWKESSNESYFWPV